MHHFCLMTLALSIVTLIITGLGPAAQYGVNALPEPELLQYRMGWERSHITHLLTHLLESKKIIVFIINICHYLTKSQFLTFSLPEKSLI